MDIRFIEMFSGIGGFRLGLEKASTEYRDRLHSPRKRETEGELSSEGEGVEAQDSEGSFGSSKSAPILQCVWANDIDRYACQIYRKQFGAGKLYEGDIRTVDVDAVPEHDLLTAGFPCQSFSIAGKRRGFEDTRGTLFFEICRIVRAKRPRLLLLENVKGLLNHDDGATFETIIRTLDELGYDCEWSVINSKDYGVPQNRERVFIIGHIRGEPGFQVFPIGETNQVYPEPGGQIAHAIDSNYHKGWLDNQQRTMIKYETSQDQKLSQDISQTLNSGHYNQPKIETAPTLRAEHHNTADVHFIVHENKSGTLTPHREAVALGAGRSHNYQTIANALDADGYLRTGARPRDENGKPQLLPIGYRRIRRLTPLECERLQGFPDGWTEGISDTQRYKCLGNAVTVNVIEAIGRRIVEEL